MRVKAASVSKIRASFFAIKADVRLTPRTAKVTLSEDSVERRQSRRDDARIQRNSNPSLPCSGTHSSARSSSCRIIRYLALQCVLNAFTPPQYWTDTLEQMDFIGVGSLPIVVIAAIFIGGVMVLQTASQFERFGETALTGDAVSLALVRELGPAITALLVAGRNASGIASELGSMVVTEQVDAMRALGTDPIRKLVTPRVIAMVLMLPLLVVVADFVGLIGGFIVAYFTLRLGPVQFWTRAIDALEFGDLVQGFAKPVIFGFIISTIGCFKGSASRAARREWDAQPPPQW